MLRKLICLLMCATAALIGLSGCGGEESPQKIVVKINDTYAVVGGDPVDFYLHFDAPYDGEVVYDYDESKLSIDSKTCMLTALEAGTHTVTVSAGTGTATFKAVCENIDYDWSMFEIPDDFKTYADQNRAKWNTEGKDGEATVFIGDSFFDTRWFWTDFYQTYKDVKAMSFGIGSTTSYMWETLLNGSFKGIQPLNLVVNVGTNNLYDDGMNSIDTVGALQRMFRMCHKSMPNTNIYYFAITQRTYGAMQQKHVVAINAAMKAFCEEREWITFLDTADLLTADTLQSDGVHPKLESYSIFTKALEDAGIQFTKK